MALNSRQADLISLFKQFAAESRRLGDNALALIGLAQDRKLVSFDKNKGQFSLLITDDDLHIVLDAEGRENKTDAYVDIDAIDILFFLTIMYNTRAAADSQTMPDGRTVNDVLRKWAGNAVLK